MDARTGYTDGMTERGPAGGAFVRAVAYVRVSSEEQRRHGYSLDDQERKLRIQIGLKGWELVEVVRDEGLSGADPSRPGLRRIEELAREGRVDVALATKRNRWFRNMEHRRRYERGLRRRGARIAAFNYSGNAIADGVDDLISEEQRREIARETRRGRRARARKGEVVAGVVPFGFRFTPDRKNFEVEEQEAAVVRKVFALAASGTGLNSVKSALQAEGVPTPRGFRGARGKGDGTTWSRLVLRQIILSDCYRPHSPAELAALVEAGNLDEAVASSAPDPAGVWWFARRGVEKVYDEDEGGRREFWDNPVEEHIAVPIPDLGVSREQVEEARRRVLSNRAPSKASRRFWELSGGILFCPCVRKMASRAESLARDLPYLLDKTLPIREYETVPEEGKVGNWLGVYKIAPDTIRRLPEEEVATRRRRAEDERAARYLAVYDDLGLRVVAHPDGTLEASWRFGEAVLRNGSDKSRNRHATQHFHTTEHPLIQSLEPGEDWIWCFVDEVVMEQAR